MIGVSPLEFWLQGQHLLNNPGFRDGVPFLKCVSSRVADASETLYSDADALEKQNYIQSVNGVLARLQKLVGKENWTSRLERTSVRSPRKAGKWAVSNSAAYAQLIDTCRVNDTSTEQPAFDH